MDAISRLSHYSVEMALMDMVRSSPALQLADNLMAQLKTGGKRWAAMSAGFMGTVRSIQVCCYAVWRLKTGSKRWAAMSAGFMGTVRSIQEC